MSDKNLGMILECDKKDSAADMDNQCVEPSSGPSSIIYSGDNEEEYLRATFSRLGVGLDGFLSLEELTKVCHAIGMDKLSSEVIDQLFCRLDVDGDGRISFEEFLLMFQIGGPDDTSHPLILDDSLTQDTSLVTSSSCLPAVGNTGMLITEFGIFSSLDPDESGYVSVSRVIDGWYSLGMRDCEKVLKELGLPHKRDDKVSLRDFGAIMEEELRLQQDSSSLPRQATTVTLLYEIKSLRSSLETARGERDKFRWDLGEANHRIGLFAQELDDQNAAMEKSTQKKLSELEKQYKEQLRDLHDALLLERENGRETALNDSRELLSLNSHLQEEEARLKSRVAMLEKDVKKLEVENLELSSKLSESISHSQTTEKQSIELKKLRNKVAEYESFSPREEEFRKLVLKVEDLVAANQKLRDCNDELIAQVDSYTSRISVGRLEDYSLEGSCIGDYLNDNSSSEGTIGGVKRRGGTSPIRENSPEDGNSEDGIGSPRESKIRRKSSKDQFQLNYLSIASNEESFVDSNSSRTSPFGFMTSPVTPVSSGQPSSLPEYTLRRTSLKDQSENKFKLDTERSFKSVLETKLCSPSSKPFTDLSSRSVIKFFQKCPSCVELESRLNVALEELEMALKREKQSSAEKEEDNNTALCRLQNVSDRCHELEEELCQMKNKFSELVQEKKQLQLEHSKCADTSSKFIGSTIQFIRSFCEESILKLKRNRTQSFTSSLSDINSPQSSLIGGRDVISTILEEEEEEEDDELNEERDKTSAAQVSGRNLETLIKTEFKKIETEMGLFEENWSKEKDLLEKQKAFAEDRFTKLEQEYQVLKSDYEKSEDYWQMKFQEEVDYYEEERKLYDEKFLALETKIKEYEEVALSSSGAVIEVPGPAEVVGEVFSDDSQDRLSTIDESAVWERQVTELEEEVKCLQKKLREAVEEKENSEIFWSQRLASEQKNSLQEISHQKTELERIKNLCRTLQLQLTSAKEELEKNSSVEPASNVMNLPNLKSYGYKSIKSKEPVPPDSQIPPCARSSYNSSAAEQATSDSGASASNSTVKGQLSLYQKRNDQLEHILKLSQKCSTEIINETNERHTEELQSLQNMITNSQYLFTSNLTKYKDQLSKVLRGDMLVRELYLENAQLMLALQITEERQKEAEEQMRKLQIASLHHKI